MHPGKEYTRIPYIMFATFLLSMKLRNTKKWKKLGNSPSNNSDNNNSSDDDESGKNSCY